MSIYCPLSEALGIKTSISILDIKEEFSDQYYNELPPWNKGLKHTEHTKRLISEKAKGRTSPRKGVVLSEETKRKISETRKGQHAGCKNPMYGRQHSDETRENWSRIRKGRNVGENNPMYGRKHAEEKRQKIREAKVKK